MGILPSFIVLGVAAATLRLGRSAPLSFLFAAFAFGMICDVDHFVRGGCFFLDLILNDQDLLSFLLLILTLPCSSVGSVAGEVRLLWRW